MFLGNDGLFYYYNMSSSVLQLCRSMYKKNASLKAQTVKGVCVCLCVFFLCSGALPSVKCIANYRVTFSDSPHNSMADDNYLADQKFFVVD